jgi:YegS/Rv2252/BmrU family lipid kinase
MRALLIANVNAATVTPRMAEVMERALSSEMKVDLQATKRQGHATHLARGAVHEDVDLVISFGGDGTVNEVANGLAGSAVPLAIIPGGGTNVLARSLGIPKDPIEATGHLLANLRNEPRRVALGRADDRYFTFACGIGLDGAIVRAVERRQRIKKTAGEWYYVWSGARLLFAGIDRSDPPVTVRWGPDLEHHRDDLFLAIVQNTRPYTYLGDREMHICPRADLDGGLDLLALDRFRLSFILRIVGQMFTTGRHVNNRHVLSLHDQQRIEITTSLPMPVEMDGEYVGDRTTLRMESVANALSVLY